MTLFVFLYFILIKKDVFVAISHVPACILNQSAHSNAICTVVTDPTEAILQAMVLLYFMPRPCYNYITASYPFIPEGYTSKYTEGS